MAGGASWSPPHGPRGERRPPGTGAPDGVEPAGALRPSVLCPSALGLEARHPEAPHPDIEQVLISQAELSRRIAELGAELQSIYTGQDVMLVGVLKGAIMFMTDLARAIALPLELDFMAVSSYGNATQSSGIVRITKDLDSSIAGRHVLLVEDIVDSGMTLRYLTEILRSRQPATLRICTLLNKRVARKADVAVGHVGFEIPDRFVVGYGLDYAESYRNLPYIGILKTSVYAPS